MKINRIYTRTGDDGTTGLVGGTRIKKNSLRVTAYGDVDELNSFLGAARTESEATGRDQLSTLLATIQNQLFDIGAQLASPAGASHASIPVTPESQVTALENAIDTLTEGLPELRSFVLPGGNALNASLHIARSVCRRAERSIITLHEIEPVAPAIIHYINRLSDLLFAMARWESAQAQIPEYLWKPG